MEPGATLSAKILVVDDEPHVIAIIEAALTNGGYTNVLTTTRSPEVVDLYRSEAPDLIIMDMNMPGVHGMDIIEELHEVVPDEEYLPILVVTGNQDVEVKLRALTWGAKDFLAKPFDVPELLLRVRMLLETRLLFNRVARPDGR
ncbi:MAG: response regulator [Gemmatimonadetes bacterium]|nr:response regulator [Gemmatimonadota bacterium]